MTSVAIVGGDGSGKTTLARKFMQTSKFPVKYLYMGLSTLKSEPAFPTTLLIRYMKTRSYRSTENASTDDNGQASFMLDYHHNPTRRSDLWRAVRSFNYLIDVLYRLVYSWIYQLRGYLVIYDRYYLFMAAPEVHGERRVFQHWIDQLLYWIFDKIYPEPDIVVFLDAPPDILYERKPEGKLDYLEKRRIATIEQGKRTANFVVLDATQPIDLVYKAFEEIILTTIGDKYS